MKFFKNKKVTVRQLQNMDMADGNGVIDYQKFKKFKEEEQEKGYNIFLDAKGFKPTNDVEIIDNEPIIYNEKEHQIRNDIID